MALVRESRLQANLAAAQSRQGLGIVMRERDAADELPNLSYGSVGLASSFATPGAELRAF